MSRKGIPLYTQKDRADRLESQLRACQAQRDKAWASTIRACMKEEAGRQRCPPHAWVFGVDNEHITWNGWGYCRKCGKLTDMMDNPRSLDDIIAAAEDDPLATVPPATIEQRDARIHDLEAKLAAARKAFDRLQALPIKYISKKGYNYRPAEMQEEDWARIALGEALADDTTDSPTPKETD